MESKVAKLNLLTQIKEKIEKDILQTNVNLYTWEQRNKAILLIGRINIMLRMVPQNKWTEVIEEYAEFISMDILAGFKNGNDVRNSLYHLEMLYNILYDRLFGGKKLERVKFMTKPNVNTLSSVKYQSR